MCLHNKKNNELYVSEFNELFAQSKFYVQNPEILKKEIFEKSKKNSIETDSIELPVPFPDPFQYEIIKHKGFVKYPQRLKNYIIAKHEKYSILRNFYPTILDIEPVTRCNFRCNMCQLTTWKKGQRTKDLDLNDFKSFIDEQYGLCEVKLQGIGEPLLHPKFIDMIEYLVFKHIWVRTTINGSLLHLHNNYQRLIDSGVSEVQISFDGATKDVFEKIRINSNFEQIRDNLTMLCSYEHSKNIVVTRLWVLLQNYNVHQIFDFVEIAKDMGFKRLTFSMALSDWGQEKFRIHNTKLSIEDKISDEIIEKLIKINEVGEIEITFWNLSSKYSFNSIETLCPWPFSRSYIGADMKIAPCCMVANPDIYSLGSAKEYISNWNSDRYINFRKMHLNGNIPNICKNCYADS